MFPEVRNIVTVEKSVCQQLIAPDSFCFLKAGTGFPYCVRFFVRLCEGLGRIDKAKKSKRFYFCKLFRNYFFATIFLPLLK